MKSLFPVCRSFALAALALGGSLAARAQLLDLNPVADTFVYFGINQNNNYGTLGYTYLFANSTIRETFAYYRFDLSSLAADKTITGATLTFFKAATGTGERNDVMNTARFGVYGLDNVAGNTAQNWGETTLTFNNRGAEWTAVNTFDLARLTNLDGTAGNETINGAGTSAAVSGANLVNFLTTRRSDGGLATFIVDQTGVDAGRGYGLGTKEGAADLIPVLSLTYASAGAVPEPATNAALFLGVAGAVVLAHRRRMRRAQS